MNGMSNNGKKTFYPSPLRHGLWAKDLKKRIDRRTKQWVNARIRFILEDIPEPSARQIVLAEHTAFLDACCRVYAMQTMAGEAPGSVNHYLAFEGHLQRNLVALGLSKRKMKEILDLEGYLKSKQGGAKEGS
jgi:hypothetical protein